MSGEPRDVSLAKPGDPESVRVGDVLLIFGARQIVRRIEQREQGLSLTLTALEPFTIATDGLRLR